MNFSKYINLWGWATWRRSWIKYDVGNMKFWPEWSKSKDFGDKMIDNVEKKYWKNIFMIHVSLSLSRGLSCLFRPFGGLLGASWGPLGSLLGGSQGPSGLLRKSFGQFWGHSGGHSWLSGGLLAI